MVRLTPCALFLAMSLFLANLSGQEPKRPEAKIDGEGARKSMELIRSFVTNREKFSRYCCAMMVERTTERLKKTGESEFAEEWYIHSFNAAANARRQDQIIATVSTDLVPVDSALTVVMSDKSVAQFNGRRVFSINSKDVDDEDDWQGLFPQSFFDPFAACACGITVMHSTPVRIPMKDYVASMAQDLEPVDFEEDPRFAGVEFCRSRKHHVFDRLVCSRRLGNMPIQFTRLIREEGYKGTLEKADISWRMLNDRWCPETVFSELTLGNPERPSTKITRRIRMFWVMGDDVPQEVFATDDSRWLAETLREFVVSTSEKLRR